MTSLTLKYSKSSSFYLKTKKAFFSENDKLLQKSLKQNHLYSSQIKRISCKICNAKLPDAIDFHSHDVDYVFCHFCTHLNGKFEDTKEFIEKLYVSQNGSDYSVNYTDKNFKKRVVDIYVPKVDFLINSIPCSKYEILDVGCGSGYFVYALLLRDIRAKGIDVSKTMVEFGNNQISQEINKTPLTFEDEQYFYEAVTKTKANIISAIGVIEHLREPHKFFDAFKNSKSQYLYYSVPMFSFSVALENIFKNVYPRQLSGGHTHLFTESSIKRMNEIIGVQPIAEWRFGTDAMDLYRHMLTNLQANQSSQKMIDFLYTGFGKNIDDIQSIFDKSHFSSEIHLIASKY